MESTLHFRLLAAHTLFQKVFLRRVNEQYPFLLPGQPKVIDFLMSHSPAFQREIADGCLIEPATLCLILEKLEKIQLIKREKTEGNRKNIQVSLTDAGENIGIYLKTLFVEVESEICMGISADERKILLSALRRIQKNGMELL